MAFGSVSGSAPATVAAMGEMVYPEMRKSGFSEQLLTRPDRLQRRDRAADPAVDHLHHLWLDDRDLGFQAVRRRARRRPRLGIDFVVLVMLEARKAGIERSREDDWRERGCSDPPRRLGARHAGHHPRRHLCRHLHADRGRRRQRRLCDLRRVPRLSRTHAGQAGHRHRTGAPSPPRSSSSCSQSAASLSYFITLAQVPSVHRASWRRPMRAR